MNMFRFFNFSATSDGNSSNLDKPVQELPRSPMSGNYDVENPEVVHAEEDNGVVQSEICSDDPFHNVNQIGRDENLLTPIAPMMTSSLDAGQVQAYFEELSVKDRTEVQNSHQYTPQKLPVSTNTNSDSTSNTIENTSSMSIREYLTKGLSFWNATYKADIITEDHQKADNSLKFDLDDVELVVPSTDSILKDTMENSIDMELPQKIALDDRIVYHGAASTCSLYDDYKQVYYQIVLDNTKLQTNDNTSNNQPTSMSPPLSIAHILHTAAPSISAFQCQPVCNAGKPLGTSLRLPKDCKIYQQSASMIIDAHPRTGATAHTQLTQLSSSYEVQTQTTQSFVYVMIASSVEHAEALANVVTLQSFLQRGQLLITVHATEHTFWHLQEHKLLPLQIVSTKEYILDQQVPVVWLIDRYQGTLPSDVLLSQGILHSKTQELQISSSKLGLDVQLPCDTEHRVYNHIKQWYKDDTQRYKKKHQANLDALYAPVYQNSNRQVFQQYNTQYPADYAYLAAQITEQQKECLGTLKSGLEKYQGKADQETSDVKACVSVANTLPVQALELIDVILQTTLTGMLLILDHTSNTQEVVLHDTNTQTKTIDCPILETVLDKVSNLPQSVTYSNNMLQKAVQTVSQSTLHTHQCNKGAVATYNVIQNNTISTEQGKTSTLLHPPRPSMDSLAVETHVQTHRPSTIVDISTKKTSMGRYLSRMNHCKEQTLKLGMLVAVWGCRYDAADTIQVSKTIDSFGSAYKLTEETKKKQRASFWSGSSSDSKEDIAVAAATAWNAARDALQVLIPLQLRRQVDLDELLQTWGLGNSENPAFIPDVVIHAVQCIVARLYVLRLYVDLQKMLGSTEKRETLIFLPTDVYTDVILPWLNNMDVVLTDSHNAFLSTMIDINMLPWHNAKKYVIDTKYRYPYRHLIQRKPEFLPYVQSMNGYIVHVIEEYCVDRSIEAKQRHTLLLTTVNNGLSRTDKQASLEWVPTSTDKGMIHGGQLQPTQFGTAFDGLEYTPRVLLFQTSNTTTTIPSLLHILGMEAQISLFTQVSNQTGPIFEAYATLVHTLMQLQTNTHPTNTAMFIQAVSNYHCPYTLHIYGELILELLSQQQLLQKQQQSLQMHLTNISQYIYPHQHYDVFLTIGRVFMLLKQYKRALHIFSTSTALYGEHRITIFNIALSYIQIKQYTQALDCMQRVLELSIHDESLHHICKKYILKLQSKQPTE